MDCSRKENLDKIKSTFFFGLVLVFIACFLYFSKANEVVPKSAYTGRSFSVLSWNTNNFGWNNKFDTLLRDSMVSIINNSKADIICLQEVIMSYDSTAFNYLDKIANQLGKKYYELSYLKKYQFDPKHQFGDVIFSDFPIVPDSLVNLDTTRRHQIARVLIDNDTIELYNLHLQSSAISKQNFKEQKWRTMWSKYKKAGNEREVESKEILDKISIDKIKKVVVVGDFNETTYSKTYETFSKIFNDAYKRCGKDRITFDNGVLKLRLDFIMYTNNISCLDYNIIKTSISDHRPIVAKISIKNNNN